MALLLKKLLNSKRNITFIREILGRTIVEKIIDNDQNIIVNEGNYI